ncbi:hypothetical protein [Nonomuraea endophytica]|uniref:Uncharacterized protein n=1 Tax=Nonomuraea endophytica TaxID=714136 RepID=A0A7W8A3P6_9ACTN|nr:hypothetical protein [Nonomuraea endophytica]MBB5077778.1 hypothetical protein [Nonomuraea endophytica]
MTDDTITDVRRNQVITDLRRLADFLDDHPEIPAPMQVDASVLPRHNGSAQTEAQAITEVERIAACLGTPVAVSHGNYTTTISFGRVFFRAFVVTDEAMARHRALVSYEGAVTPYDEAV